MRLLGVDPSLSLAGADSDEAEEAARAIESEADGDYPGQWARGGRVLTAGCL